MKVKIKIDENILTILKIAFFIYIVLSPFINYKYLTYLNNICIKVILLVIIVTVSFIDLQLAIIMTLAFLILIINMNSSLIFGQKTETFSVGLPVAEIKRIETLPSQTIYEFPDKCDSPQTLNPDKQTQNKNLYDLYIDSKIKPYEAYIRQLSNPIDIENAANAML
jgi:hypothetical protein